jgi:membrane protein DedA with SNARE-associated domain
MDNLFEHLGTLVAAYPAWSNIIIAIATLLQGEVAILFSMYLVISGQLSIGQFVLSAMGGLFVGETFLYFLGRTVRHTRFGWKLYYKLKPNRRIQLYTYYLKKNLKKLLIAAKFLIGTNLVILVLVGWSKTKPGEFLKAYLLSLICWFVSMSAVAYFLASGVYLLRSENIFRNIEIGIVVVLALMIGGEMLLKRFLAKRMFGSVEAADLKGAVDEELEEK